MHFLWSAIFLTVLAMPSGAHAVEGKINSSTFLDKLTGKGEDFAELKRTRRKMVRDIDSTEREINSLELETEQLARNLVDAPRELTFLKGQQTELEGLISKVKSGVKLPAVTSPGILGVSPGDANDLENLIGKKNEIDNRVKDIEARQGRLRQAATEVQQKRESLSTKQNDLLDLEDRIANALSMGTNQYVYRIVISLVFATIVFAMVLKFFRIVSEDEVVKRSIFSGEAGIQFITLFSIVIAVILFGILDILGANELSALLGGLSGYILGKSAPFAKATASTPAAPVTE